MDGYAKAYNRTVKGNEESTIRVKQFGLPERFETEVEIVYIFCFRSEASSIIDWPRAINLVNSVSRYLFGF